jgi:hypothetical protein
MTLQPRVVPADSPINEDPEDLIRQKIEDFKLGM